MRFGDAVVVTTGTHSELAVFLSRSEGCQPSIFLNGRAVPLDLGAIMKPWVCDTCHGSRIVWAIRIPPRCGACRPLSTTEREFVLRYATGAAQHLVGKLDDPAAKAAIHQLLDDAILSGDMRELMQVTFDTLAWSHIMKHERGDLL